MNDNSINKYVSNCLRQVGNLCYFSGDNKFAVSSYFKAADIIEFLNDSVINVDVTKIYGIGNGSIANKIKQIINTGTCDKIDELMPLYGYYLDLMKIPGIGFSLAKKFYNDYNAKSIDDIRKLVESGKIKNKRIVEGLKGIGTGERFSFDYAYKIANDFINKLKDCCGDKIEKIEFAGSLRRKKITIGDLDIIIYPKESFKEIVSNNIRLIFDAVDSDGPAKISGSIGKIHFDIRFADKNNYGSMLMYFTGSKEFNIKTRILAVKFGYLLNEYGLWKGEEKICGENEEDIFTFLKIDYVEPENR